MLMGSCMLSSCALPLSFDGNREVLFGYSSESPTARTVSRVVLGLDLRTESEEEVRRRLTAAREAVAVCQDRLLEHAERARALAGEHGSLERDLADLREQLAQAEQARAQHRVDLENAQRRLREARSETETRHDEQRNTEAELERARHALAAAARFAATSRVSPLGVPSGPSSITPPSIGGGSGRNPTLCSPGELSAAQ